jgi:hypothetical protein
MVAARCDLPRGVRRWEEEGRWKKGREDEVTGTKWIDEWAQASLLLIHTNTQGVIYSRVRYCDDDNGDDDSPRLV